MSVKTIYDKKKINSNDLRDLIDLDTTYRSENGDNEDESFIADDTGIGIGMLESPTIPEEFHEALTYMAIAKGYERNPQTINNAIYFRNLFKEEVSKGKQHANKDKDGTAYFIQGHDY